VLVHFEFLQRIGGHGERDGPPCSETFLSAWAKSLQRLSSRFAMRGVPRTPGDLRQSRTFVVDAEYPGGPREDFLKDVGSVIVQPVRDPEPTRRGDVRSPALVVAPMSVYFGRLSCTVLALGPNRS